MNDDGEVVPLADLTEKERRFVEALANPENETFANRQASAEAAGYAGARSAAWKVLQRDRVREALKAYTERMQRGLDFVMLQVENIGRKAEQAGDWSTALRAAELLAKRLGGFSERLIVTGEQKEARRRYSEAEEAEARRLGRLLIEDGERPALEAEDMKGEPTQEGADDD